MKIFTSKQITTLTFALALSAAAQLSAQTAFMKVVAADGSGDYTTVQAAVDAAPKDGTRTLIFIKDGSYKEQIDIPSGAVISLIGESRDGTVLWYDKGHTSDGGIYTDASETSTIYVDGLDFYGDNFTTQNRATLDNGGQAECFTVASDRATLRHVNLNGVQDGVRFFNASRSYLKDCYIEGRTDYIYDSGIAFIDDCTIKQVVGGGYIVAPGDCYVTVSRSVSRELTGQARTWGIGLFLRGCRLIYDAEAVGENASHLGRNWGKTSCAAYFLNCYMDKHIKPEGWAWMSDTRSVYMGEYGSMDMDGNPIDVSKRVDWAMTEDPDHMTSSQYIDEKVVDNLFGMDYVFNLADETLDGKLGTFNPLPLVEPAAAPSSFSAVDGVLSWTASDGAAGYIIYKNGAYMANVTETSYTDATGTDADRYTLRTVTPTGCLGAEVTGTATGLCHVTADDLKIYTTRYGVSWNRTATATLYSVSGEALVSRTGISLDWGRLPKGVYILRLAFADGTSLTRKVVRK